MKTNMKTHVLTLLAGAITSLFVAPGVHAQAPDDVRTAFLQWAKASLHPVSSAELDASTKDLAPIEKMIGNAKIVAVGEFVHAGAEPLIFRNRMFKHLVEHYGFTAIAIESGVVEGRLLNDYVTHGKGDFATVL
jgi:erythromycin esterase